MFSPQIDMHCSTQQCLPPGRRRGQPRRPRAPAAPSVTPLHSAGGSQSPQVTPHTSPPPPPPPGARGESTAGDRDSRPGGSEGGAPLRPGARTLPARGGGACPRSLSRTQVTSLGVGLPGPAEPPRARPRGSEPREGGPAAPGSGRRRCCRCRACGGGSV